MNSPSALEPDLLSDAAVFRQFNRIYTRFIGTLDEGLLHTEYSLAEARVLYELATGKSPSARQVSAELGIDAGYLSRILTKFEHAGLLKRKASPQDARSAEINLSPAGKSAFKNLDALANAQAGVLLRGLAHANRTELIRSMRAIEGILAKPKAVRQPFILRPPRPGDMGWVVSREGAVYHEEYGWDQTFEALVARIVSDFVTNFNPARERCWIADVNGQSAGHIFLVQHPRPCTYREAPAPLCRAVRARPGTRECVGKRVHSVCACSSLSANCSVDARHSGSGTPDLSVRRLSASGREASP